MKIAIVHDWLTVNGGAEKVLKAILDIFPNADVFSLVDYLEEKYRLYILKGKRTETSFVQRLPFSKKFFRNYLPIFPKAIESFNLKEYDTIISSSWAFAKGIKKRKGQMHVCYCHTPIRYAWDLKGEYLGRISLPKRLLAEFVLHYIRKWDLETADRVDEFIANSQFVAKRIKRIYKRNARVIYPPVDTNSFKLHEKKEDYYLTVSRLVPYKKIDIIIEAFNEMRDKRLVVIGFGEEYNKLKRMANRNVEFLGYQDKKIVVNYMKKAKGFVFAALEDFGIAPVEAMACGTPVIAFGFGGVRETVIDGFSGVFFFRQNSNDIIDAIKRFEKLNFDYNAISTYAQRFSEDRFKREFKRAVERYIEELEI